MISVPSSIQSGDAGINRSLRTILRLNLVCVNSARARKVVKIDAAVHHAAVNQNKAYALYGPTVSRARKGGLTNGIRGLHVQNTATARRADQE